MNKIILSIVALTVSFYVSAQKTSEPASSAISSVWVSDNGNGTYTNPVLHADYSDPDAVRVGDDFYLTASSFNCIPGLPILHSKDLVNWRLIGYALLKQPPFDVFNKPQHGKGVWAPCIRYHNNEFYIYYPDPDFGIYMVKAKNPAGPWSAPIMVKEGKGLIDPTPLWDDDGKAYLAFAFAGSRAGFKSILSVCTMSPEGDKLLDDPVLVLDGHKSHPTVEGPKFYKRNGYYYIFAPAGGVATGWQLVMRSKNVYGPYEEKIVMDQGASATNGPHQGAWVDTSTGEHWFLHFQDKGPFGRIVHLQPMQWVNDWPVIGVDKDNDGKGEPVLTYKKPQVKSASAKFTPPDSDEFNSTRLGLQWQWHANFQYGWGFPTANGIYKMFCMQLPEGFKNFWDVPNLLLQKFPAPRFMVTTKVTFTARSNGEKTGLIIMGRDYAYIAVKQVDGALRIAQTICKNADKQNTETENQGVPITSSTFYLRAKVADDGMCDFSYSEDGTSFKPIGERFKSREGGWIGAKVGLFAVREGVFNDAGNIDVDWFRIEK